MPPLTPHSTSLRLARQLSLSRQPLLRDRTAPQIPLDSPLPDATDLGPAVCLYPSPPSCLSNSRVTSVHFTQYQSVCVKSLQSQVHERCANALALLVHATRSMEQVAQL